MKKTFTLLFCLQAAGTLFSQNTFIKGTVSDSKTKETIVGASVIVDDSTGTSTDINGSYFYKITSGKHKTEFKYIGYKSQVKIITGKGNDTIRQNIVLEPDSKTLDIVVVSAGKFEQKISDVTVSMEVIKPSLIENKAVTSVSQAVDQVPGVNVIDGQANIRGGSGWSYGAGSRVLIMVDEMPMLTATQGDAKWTFLPIENCEQVEVIKGASSALFGSSAMNGVINFRTGYAKDEPETKVAVSGGFYSKPKRESLINWWQGGNPSYAGLNFYHAEKIGNLDLVVGGNMFNDDGYRYSEYEQRYRFNANLRYRFKKIAGLAVGVNFNIMNSKGGLFTLWRNPDSAYYPSPGPTVKYSANRTNIDPFITYTMKDGGRHSLRTRFFKTVDLNTTNQESNGEMYYAEYQFQKHFASDLTWTSGAVYNYGEVHSGAIYGTHFTTNTALYTQWDKKFKKLSLSFGIRGEYYKTDSIETRENINLLMDASKPIAKQSKVKPVLRAGANYHLAEATFLRASFGQGFRFPTIAERYIKTSAGGLDVYPNTALTPESGWSSEIAVKQGVKMGNWKGFVDLAAFWTEYRNMMEFTFGHYAPTFTPPNFGFGFQSQNIGNTRIRGIEATFLGEGKMGPIGVSALIGYSYIDPRQIDYSLAQDTMNALSKNTSGTNLLKYRYQHTGKADVEFTYKKVSTGVSIRANSFMQSVDGLFENEAYFPGMREYRLEHNKGDMILDYRLAYQLDKTSKIALIVNNVFNREVMDRPASIAPPRVIALQLVVKL